MTRLITITIIATLVLLLGVRPADAACSLAGVWDGYFVLQAGGDNDRGGVPTFCKIWITRSGIISNAICDFLVEVRDSEGLEVNRSCRASGSVFLELDDGMDLREYDCRVRVTVSNDNQSGQGVLDCVDEADLPSPTLFSLVRRR
jgi:hypothetical protein